MPCQLREASVSKRSMTNFVHSLVAVLAGNAAYFLLMPLLPLRARHAPFQIDLGLLLDFCFCLVAFGIVKTVSDRRRVPQLGQQLGLPPVRYVRHLGMPLPTA